ncbi:cryptochrome/photolyase family protein [Humidisolicoccus flavus]|uniref:cryptochrome/photolyase family protein n=1 Tax=Humidisolicoccus flavus TaxID=3111414 RepID=UPI00324412FD
MTRGLHLRLVFPHQLFAEQFKAPKGTVFVLVEHDLFFRQYAFHSHKLVLHRASITRFASKLQERGFETEYLHSSAERASHEQLLTILRQRRPEQITWFDVVDDWLERDIQCVLDVAGVNTAGETATSASVEVLESPNFVTTRQQIDEWFAQNDARMHDFYIWQRQRLGILVENGAPRGGRWSFDADNRKKLPRGYEPPAVHRFHKHPVTQQTGMLDFDSLVDEEHETRDDADEARHRRETAEQPSEVAQAIEWVQREFPDAPGDPMLFAWPTNTEEAREHLAEFVRERLGDFGPYEDAISQEHPFINHGLLTPPLNIGLLNPREIVEAVLDGAREDTSIASVEGFVRQVIGWREYMRATYRTQGRSVRTSNVLNHRNALGPGWWEADTGLAPVDLVISRVLATGYAHHIERLMVLGNAMSLLRVHPDRVYEWFMEMFVDAYDWVMVPNVYAMSQFAAGDTATTKPYVSGSNYLRTMSDLPKGEWVADWDALYWAFIDEHRTVFASNPRANMVVALLDNMDTEKWRLHRERADRLLSTTAKQGTLVRVE